MRIITCGFEEVANATDLTQTMFNGASSGVTIVTPPSPRTNASSLGAAKFATNVGAWLTRSLVSTKTTGILHTRMYALWTGFGAAANVNSVVARWVISSGALASSITFNPSTKKFGSVNNASGSPVTASGSFVISANHWYRIEKEVVLASDTTGSITLKIYDGDTMTVLDTMTLSAQATVGTTAVPVYAGIESGNRSTADWGDLYFDDYAINDELTSNGDGQTTWCGPGCIVMVKPNSVVSTQWSPAGTSMKANNALNVGIPPLSISDGASYNHITDTTSIDRYGITSTPTLNMSQFNVMDIYARVGSSSASTCTMTTVYWDDNGTRSTGPTITIALNGWEPLTSTQHNVIDISSKTKAQVDSFNIGVMALGGSGIDKRVDGLWANIEYQPSLLVAVSRTLGSAYEAQTLSARALTHDHEMLSGPTTSATSNWESTAIVVTQTESSPWESLGTVQVANSVISAYEALVGVSTIL